MVRKRFSSLRMMLRCHADRRQRNAYQRSIH
jgi:hypothetical protein